MLTRFVQLGFVTYFRAGINSRRNGSKRWRFFAVRPHASTSEEDHHNLLADVGNKPVVLEFQYPGCILCEEIAGEYKAARDANPDIVFKKVNVYEQMSLLEEYSIKAMPSFVIWVNGEE